MSKTFDMELRVSRTSPPKSVEVQPSLDDVLKREEQAKPLQRRQSERVRRPSVRNGIDEYFDAAVESILHQAYYARQIVKRQTMKEALVGVAHWSERKQPVLSMPH